jgi:predicted RNase H-like HicB family nuclease
MIEPVKINLFALIGIYFTFGILVQRIKIGKSITFNIQYIIYLFEKHINWVFDMAIYDFKVIVEPDETGGYVVTCPSLPGCYSQGETLDEALANIKEAILLCIEDMEANGEKIPDSSKALVGTVMVAVDEH